MGIDVPVYPAFCFPHSPTYNRWVKLSAADVQALRVEPHFNRQGIYFHLNHPIRFVYLIGCVVAIDSPYTKYSILTVDDGSNATIDARITLLLHSAEDGDGDDSTAAEEISGWDDPRLRDKVMRASTDGITVTNGTEGHVVRLHDRPIDVGTVLKVKGSLHNWRGSLQLTLIHASIVDTLDQELAFWDDYVEKWTKTLSTPWHINPEQMQSLREKDRQRVEHSTERNRIRRTRLLERQQRQMARAARRQQAEEEKTRELREFYLDIDGNPLDTR